MKAPSYEPKTFWDDIYRRKRPHEVSWYQPHLQMSLDLIGKLGLPHTAAILDVGAGTSTFAEDLLKLGFSDITVLDASEAALDNDRDRLGKDAIKVKWNKSEITQAQLEAAHYVLWHDRAMFHFLTDEKDRLRYVEKAQHSIKPEGYLIIATFGLTGPERCSGLSTVRFDEESLKNTFGKFFEYITHVNERHITPSGIVQDFLYCVFKRQNR